MSTLLLSPDETSARVSLNFSSLSSPESVAHIHGPAAPGITGPVLFPLPQDEFSDFEISLGGGDVQNLKNGLLYIDVHSNTFAGGEIRGQFQMSTAASSFQLNSATLLVTEGGGDAVVRVTRLGNSSTPATVNYATSDTAATNYNAPNSGNASSRCDYETHHRPRNEWQPLMSLPELERARKLQRVGVHCGGSQKTRRSCNRNSTGPLC